MKKFLMSLTVGAMVILGAVGCTNEAPQPEQKQSVGVIEQNGFKVLDIKQKENRTTIACQARSNKDFGFTEADGELTCLNIYDDADLAVLSPEQAKGFEIGDLLLVTFNGDNVEKVEKNTYMLRQ